VKETEDLSAAAPTRRAFCVQAASFVALGALLEACGGGSPTAPSGSVPSLPVVSATASGGAVTIPISQSSPLGSVGGAALVQTSQGNFLVARTSQDGFTALTALCTHQACTVSGFTNQEYVCPCHGSRFNLTGAVLSGPAPRALRSFATQFANGVLTISI